MYRDSERLVFDLLKMLPLVTKRHQMQIMYSYNENNVFKLKTRKYTCLNEYSHQDKQNYKRLFYLFPHVYVQKLSYDILF